jgi:chromosome segregation ATPase
LAANRSQLRSDRLELKRQLEESRDVETKLRAEGDAVSALLGKLQKRVTSLESELEAARAAAEDSKKAAERLGADAANAKTAFAQVAKLQEQLAVLNAERDAARAEMDEGRKATERLTAEVARAKEEKSALEREIADLEDELGRMRGAAPATTGTNPKAP